MGHGRQVSGVKGAIGLTTYQGRAGDRNDLAWPGARKVAEALSSRLGSRVVTVGRPQAPLNRGWEIELAEARSDLEQLALRTRQVLAAGGVPFTALNRCAAAIATLPAVAEAHPDAAIVWFDAHADLNTPASTSSGYLGGMALSGPAGLWDSGFGAGIGLDRVILVGSRDLDPFEEELIGSGQVRLVRSGSEDVAAELLRQVAGRPVYIHLDCDVLEPGCVPTDFSVPGGLTLARLGQAFEALATLSVIGLEVAEFQARWAPGGAEASTDGLLAALAPLLDAVRARTQPT